MEEKIVKEELTQDELLKVLDVNGIKLVRIAELMGLSEAMVNICFHHAKNKNGKPFSFSPEAIDKLNEAVRGVASGLASCLLVFRGKKEEGGRKAYDKTLIEPIKKIGEWVNLIDFLNRTLGWNKVKKNNVLVFNNTKVYGHITQQDADAINAELLRMVSDLSRLQVVYSDALPTDTADK